MERGSTLFNRLAELTVGGLVSFLKAFGGPGMSMASEIKSPRRISALFLACTNVLAFSLVATSVLWLYRGALFELSELRVLILVFGLVSGIGLFASFVPLRKTPQDYRFSREKFAFFIADSISLEFVRSQLELIGYRSVSDRVFFHQKISDTSVYKRTNDFKPHFLEVSISSLDSSDSLVVLRAWPANKLAAADWSLSIHYSLVELERNVFHGMKKISFQELKQMYPTILQTKT